MAGQVENGEIISLEEQNLLYQEAVETIAQVEETLTTWRRYLICPFEIRKRNEDSKYEMVSWSGRAVISTLILLIGTVSHVGSALGRIYLAMVEGVDLDDLLWLAFSVGSAVVVVKFVYSVTIGRAYWLEVMTYLDELAESMKPKED